MSSARPSASKLTPAHSSEGAPPVLAPLLALPLPDPPSALVPPAPSPSVVVAPCDAAVWALFSPSSSVSSPSSLLQPEFALIVPVSTHTAARGPKTVRRRVMESLLFPEMYGVAGEGASRQGGGPPNRCR